MNFEFSFMNFDNVKVDDKTKVEIFNNIDTNTDEVDIILFENVESFIKWSMIDDEHNIVINYILNDGFKSPNKTFKQIIQDQFIKDDMRVSQLENGMVLFQYE